MKTSIGSKPIKISGRSVLIGIGAIVLIAISPAFYHVMTILNIAMAAAIFAYLVYPPAREKLSATLKFIPQKASTGKAVALLLLFGFCTLLSIAGWGAALEESKKARAQIEAELTSNREIFSQVDSAIAGSEFEKALQLITKATDNPETIKEKEEKRKLVAEKSLEYFANQGRGFSQKGKWKEAHVAFTKYFGLASAETGMADDLKQAVYKSAVGLSQIGALEEAISLFERIKGVSDSEQQIAQLQEALKEKQYQQAVSLFQQKKYAEAQLLFAKLGTYSDSAEYLEKVNKIVEEEKRIAAYNDKINAAQKIANEMEQFLNSGDTEAAGKAMSEGMIALDEAEKLVGVNATIRAIRSRFSRGESKINRIIAERQRQAKIAAQYAAAEQAYRAGIAEIMPPWSQALSGIGTQSTLAGSNPTLIFDSDWVLVTAGYLAVMKMADDAVRQLSPPPRFQAAHRKLLAAGRESKQIADLYAQGVDEVNGQKIVRASAKMAELSRLVNEATSLLPKD